MKLPIVLSALALAGCVSDSMHRAGEHTTITSAPSSVRPASADANAPQKCGDGGTPDGLTRVLGDGMCLAARTYVPDRLEPDAPIAVFLHGDGGGWTSSKYLTLVGSTLANKHGLIAVALVRPGYSDGRIRSEGEARVLDDDYTPTNTRAIAGAVKNLKSRYPGRKVIMIGHSGGAALSALVMALHPETADAAILVGCPCDVPAWRAWRIATAGRSTIWGSLSPLKYADRVAKSAMIIAVTGEKDDNTTPRFAESFVAALKKSGIRLADHVIAPGATHGNSIVAPAYHSAVARIAEELTGSPRIAAD